MREAGRRVSVVRNDEADANALLAARPEGVIISPGPRTPAEAGVSMPLIAAMAAAGARIPLLGVCLGHQCLVEHFGGRTVRARRPMHGEAAVVRHDGAGVFAGLPSPLPAGRYHSLVSVAPLVDGPLAEVAWSEEGELMGARCVDRPWHGVQFHPESLLTEGGRVMMANFLSLCRRVETR